MNVTEIKLIVILIILLGVAVGAGYTVYKYEDMSKTIQQNAVVQQQLVKANKDKDIQIAEDKKDLALQQADYGQLQQALDNNARALTNLQRKFKTTAGAVGSQDLGTLAAVKPGLVEALVNRGTNEAFECLEIATGAKLNEIPTSCAQLKPVVGLQSNPPSNPGH